MTRIKIDYILGKIDEVWAINQLIVFCGMDEGKAKRKVAVWKKRFRGK